MKTIPPTAPDTAPDDADIAPPMLSAIGEEVYLLASEIAALGEDLSNLCEAHMTPALSQRLQLFDPLCQRALAQARLLRGMSFLLASGISDSSGYLNALIEEIPFEQDRQRLANAIGGLVKKSAGNDARSSGELDWF